MPPNEGNDDLTMADFSPGISGISGISGINPIVPGLGGSSFADATDSINTIAGSGNGLAPAARVDGPGGPSDFGAVLDQLTAVETRADNAAVALATGQLQNPHEFTQLAAQARLTTQLTAAIRNRALEAFNDVMRMQV